MERNKNVIKYKKSILNNYLGIYNYKKLNRVIFFFLFLFSSIKTLNECDINTPILKENKCVLEYCSKEEFDNLTCEIKNEVIKIQWLTRIIHVGEKDFRYINFASFSNGDLILVTTACPGSAQRVFYGLQKNGRFLFNYNGILTPFFSKNVTDQTDNTDNKRYEAEVFFAKMKETGKEYLISIPRASQYMELYDFENNKIYQKKAKNVLGYRMTSYRQSAINFISSNNENYVILCFSSDNGSSSNQISLYVNKFELNSISNDGFQSIKSYNEYDIIGNSLSCFLTKKIILYVYILLKQILVQFLIL